MKTVRVILIVLGAAIVATALAAAVAFVPAVQRWALVRFAARWPGTSLTVDQVAIRPGSCRLRQLRLTRPGLQVELAGVSADLSLWEAVVHHRAVVRDLKVTGLRIDLTGAPAAGNAAASAGPPEVASAPATAAVRLPAETPAAPPFGGILGHLQPPCEITVASCRIEAEIVLPRTAARPGRHVRISLTGGRFAPGREAQFDFEAAVNDRDSGRPVDRIEGRGILTATLDRQSRFEQISARMTATASGPLLRAPARLEVDVALKRTPEGETYVLALRSPETGAEGRLLDLEAASGAGRAPITGSWQVRASRRQVAPFALGAALPEFSAVGEGRFEFNRSARAVRLTGRLAGDVSQLEVLDPRLQAVGRLGATAAFDLEYGGGAVRISQLVVGVNGPKPVLSVEAIQPFSLDLASHTLTATDPRRELLQVNLEGLPVSWARPFVSAVELAGEEIKGTLAASLHEGQMWVRTTAPLTLKGLTLARSGRVVLPASDVRIEAGWEQARTATRIRLDALTLETGAGDRIDARGELNLASGTTLRAEFTAALPALLSGYAPVGPVHGRGTVACTLSAGRVRCDHLEVHLATPDGRPLADLTSPTAFQFDRDRGLVAAASGETGEVLRLAFGRLPVAIFHPEGGGCRLGGELQPGELRAQSEPGELRVMAAAPLRVTQFSIGGREGAWVRDLAVELEPVVNFAAGGLTATLGAARVNNAAGAQLLSAHGDVSFGAGSGGTGAQGAAGFDLSVPALAGQPILGGNLPPPQGRISGEAKFTFDRDLLGEGRITLNGLVSPATNEPLPVANLSFRAGWSEEGTVAVQAPLLIDRAGERSDLTVGLTLHTAGPDRRLEARISGQHFVVDDARALIRAFAPPAAAPAAERPPGTPPAAAPWTPLTGRVVLDVQSLVCDRHVEVTGLAGTITVDPARIAAEKITGRLGADGVLQLSGEARFVAGAAAPFTARYDFQLRECEIGPLFRTAAPGEAPALEGRFNVRSVAEGAGRTLGEVIARTRGDYVLQSRKGVFRGLQLAPPAPRGSGLVGGAARLIDNLGEKVGSLVSYDAPTQELAGLLTAFPYDQLNARLSRDAGRNLTVADFTLVSPVVRLQGAGVVTYEPGKGMLERPLQLRLTMGVMGKAEAMIARFKSPALSGERDELGFMKLREPFAVAGTLGRPEAGQLYAMLKPTLVQRILP